MSVRSWRHRSEYLIARVLEAGTSLLPERAAERFGEALGGIVRSPFAIRRATVEENLRRAFPEATQEWIQETTRGTFRHLGREAVTMLRLAGLDPATIVARTPIEGWPDLLGAVEGGKGAILVTGHFGNWEVAAAAVAARGVPIDAVVKRLANPLVDARLARTRAALGIGTIDMDRAPTRVPRALAAGRVIGMVADQDARDSGVWVPFFGHPASTHRGPAYFALRLDAPLFASAAYRLPTGAFQLVTERVPVHRTGDLEADVQRTTAALAARLEAVIRLAPEQYFWFHKRWKTRPPTELGPELTGTTDRSA